MKNELGSLERKILRLRGLIKVSSILSSKRDLPDLLESIMNISTEVMRAEASSLMLLDESGSHLCSEIAIGEKGEALKQICSLPVGEGIAGWVAQHKKILNIRDVTQDFRFCKEPDMKTGFVTRSLVCVPLINNDTVIGVLEALNPFDRSFFSEDDVEIFSVFAGQAAIAIERARMQQKEVKQKMIEHELEIAKEIQENFLPRGIPESNHFEFAAKSVPAHEIGGDFFDFVFTESGRSSVSIGDVSGKGIPAALYMVKAITVLRREIHSGKSLVRSMTRLNELLVQESSRGMFVTGIVLDLNENDTITMINAGHVPPIWFSSGQNRVSVLKENYGPPLGIIPDADYPVQELEFKAGDALVLCTDGIVEAQSPRGVLFGLNRLEKLIAKIHIQSAGEIAELIFDTVRDFVSSDQFGDDFTVVCVKRT